MWTEKKKKRALKTIITYGTPHRWWLLRGMLASVGVVFFRLLMPWPLRGVIEVVFPRSEHDGRLLVDFLPEWGEPVLLLCVAYIIIAFGLGLFEMFQRVNVMRFASQTVHDMRGAAVQGAGALSPNERTASGDFIARIIGDSARIKAGLAGIIVHGLQNGLLFLLVCAVMLYISISLGLIFLVAGIIAIFIGLYTSKPVAVNVSKQRKKEGNYASVLQEGIESGDLDNQLDEINWSSSRKEVRTTKLIARSSLYVHLVLALAVGLALWVGSVGVADGFIAPGDLFIFIAYALTVHRRMVQVGRQTARTGKVLACADRIGVYLRPQDKTVGEGAARSKESGADTDVKLKTGLRLERVKLDSARGRGARPRLRRTDLTILPESHVAVIGNIGAGKSSLLQLMAGVDVADKGSIFWDEEDMTGKSGTLCSRVAYLAQDIIFPPTPLWKILGFDAVQELSPEQEETLEHIEALKLVKSFSKGLKTKVGSSNISRNEARILRLAGILLNDTSSLWILDNPVQGLRGKKAKLSIEEILRCAKGRALVVGLAGPIAMQRFDRVVTLRNGKLRFEGTPGEYSLKFRGLKA
ncbi:MAG: ABC transporter ATP-binding protein [Proteobacteria bacterium]|nr:ABC transporter ATP-binding protein [Pseudomonadota bacterium]